jgi:hypothetical protein
VAQNQHGQLKSCSDMAANSVGPDTRICATAHHQIRGRVHGPRVETTSKTKTATRSNLYGNPAATWPGWMERRASQRETAD